MAVLEAVLFGIAVFVIAGWCFQWYIHLLGITYARWKMHRGPPQMSAENVPGISILKPLMGIDPHLYENLETFFNLEYPCYELLFCLEEDTDPALMVVNSLIEKYPKVDTRLFIGLKKIGINPKVNNMMEGYKAAKYDLVMISDSGIKMMPKALFDMAAHMKEKVGVVHQMPFCEDRKGFATVVEKVYFGTQHGKMYLNANFLGINCMTGMSCLFRREVLDEVGGLAVLSSTLAEDFYLGQVFYDRGWRLVISSYPALQNAGTTSLMSFNQRMIRWQKLRYSLLPVTIVLEPVSECVVLGLFASVAAAYAFNWSPVAFFFVHCLVWFLFDYILLTIVQGGTPGFSKFEFVIGWLLRECTSLYLVIKAHSSPVLKWRSKQYVIKWGGFAEEIKAKTYV